MKSRKLRFIATNYKLDLNTQISLKILLVFKKMNELIYSFFQ